MINRTEYIANCIERILETRCRVDKGHQRFLDIAEAIAVASLDGWLGKSETDGERAAHDYLRELLVKAEEGHYDQ